MDRRIIKAESVCDFILDQLPHNCVGMVHSVFSRAVNIKFNDFLIVICDKDLKNQPFGLVVDLDGFDLILNCGPGEIAQWDSRNRKLCLNRLVFDFSTALVWKSAFSNYLLQKDFQIIAQNIAYLRYWFSNEILLDARQDLLAFTDGKYLQVNEKFDLLDFFRADPLVVLEDSFLESNSAATAGELERIIGLGSGLTPFGDDFIIGLLGTLLSSGYQGTRGSMAELCSEVYIRSKRKTTDISLAFFHALSFGLISERLQNLIQGFGSSECRDDFLDLARDMLKFGSSSGLATLLGCAFGFNILQETLSKKLNKNSGKTNKY